MYTMASIENHRTPLADIWGLPPHHQSKHFPIGSVSNGKAQSGTSTPVMTSSSSASESTAATTTAETTPPKNQFLPPLSIPSSPSSEYLSRGSNTSSMTPNLSASTTPTNVRSTPNGSSSTTATTTANGAGATAPPNGMFPVKDSNIWSGFPSLYQRKHTPGGSFRSHTTPGTPMEENYMPPVNGLGFNLDNSPQSAIPTSNSATHLSHHAHQQHPMIQQQQQYHQQQQPLSASQAYFNRVSYPPSDLYPQHQQPVYPVGGLHNTNSYGYYRDHQYHSHDDEVRRANALQPPIMTPTNGPGLAPNPSYQDKLMYQQQQHQGLYGGGDTLGYPDKIPEETASSVSSGTPTSAGDLLDQATKAVQQLQISQAPPTAVNNNGSMGPQTPSLPGVMSPPPPAQAPAVAPLSTSPVPSGVIGSPLGGGGSNNLTGGSSTPTSTTGSSNNSTTASGGNSQKQQNAARKKKQTTNTELYKTELCASFMSTGGNCPYGEKCQFAHGEKELKYVDRPPKWRSKPCQNWVKNGSCSYNARCCFRHDNP